uniref:C-C chemokine receptor type 4 n=1 Tax=Ciona intestinalis TaxID=7719 RepID=UPI000180CABA|nr:C-C chemokine receptor type 4 [Ciona intestinalis]|eukprot:XP_002121573.1 C-C chemokine receptor type 4 [Ciona intestinalis]
MYDLLRQLTSNDSGTFTPDQIDNTCDNPQPNVPFAVVSVALVVLGLFGNMVVAFIILVLQEYKKSVANWYILQLALADTLFLLMLPFTASSELVGQWTYGVELCKVKEAILFINYYASIYFLVVMSFDRYVAVTKAFASSSLVTRLRSPEASYIFTTAGWIISILFSVPLFMYSSVSGCHCAYQFPSYGHEYGYMESYCQQFMQKFPGDYESVQHCINETRNTNLTEHLNALNESFPFDYDEFEVFADNITTIAAASETVTFPFQYNGLGNETLIHICKHQENRVFFVWLSVNFVFAFCLPLILISFFYGMIIKTIMQSKKVGNNEAQRSYRRRVTTIVLALVFLFVASWLPWHSFQLAKIVGFPMPAESCTNFQYGVRITAYLSSALNPFLYSFLGARFAQRLTKAKETMRLSATRHSRVLSGDSKRNKRHHSTSHSGSVRQPTAERPAEAARDVVYWRGTTENGNTGETFANKTEKTEV